MMECHDVRILLSFAQRSCEQLDVTEREALQQHLDKCPDCAAFAQADRRLDEVLGQTMRDVPVPAGLKDRITSKLAAQRQPTWKAVGTKAAIGAALAASLLLAIVGGVTYLNPRPHVTLDDAKKYWSSGSGWTEESIVEHFAAQRLTVTLPPKFNYQYVQHIETVSFKRKQVAKLTFLREASNKEPSSAEVLILSEEQFRLDGLPTIYDMPGSNLRVWRTDGFAYLIYTRGELKSLLTDLN